MTTFLILVNDKVSFHIEEREGYKKVIDGLTFYAHKDGVMWSITEHETGLRVTLQPTKRQAYEWCAEHIESIHKALKVGRHELYRERIKRYYNILSKKEE